MRKALFLLLVIMATACTPTIQVARVRPDRVTPIRPEPQDTPILADVYYSADRMVELQVYESDGRDAPVYQAVLINHRIEPLEFDLSKARRSVEDEEDSAYGSSWFEGCQTAPKSTRCTNTTFVLKPGESKRIRLEFGTVMSGELSIPFYSKRDDSIGKVVARFKYCNPYWGKCETIR